MPARKPAGQMRTILICWNRRELRDGMCVSCDSDEVSTNCKRSNKTFVALCMAIEARLRNYAHRRRRSPFSPSQRPPATSQRRDEDRAKAVRGSHVPTGQHSGLPRIDITVTSPLERRRDHSRPIYPCDGARARAPWRAQARTDRPRVELCCGRRSEIVSPPNPCVR